MRFAIRPSEGGPDFDAAVKQTKKAEEYGIDTVYLGEHHGWPDSPYWPTPLVGLAALARETDAITVGTNILLLPLANPVRVAGEIAYLDRIADGRTVFGFGVGWRQTEFDAFGIPRAERGRRMTEYLELLNELFDPGPTTYGASSTRSRTSSCRRGPPSRPARTSTSAGWATTSSGGWMT